MTAGEPGMLLQVTHQRSAEPVQSGFSSALFWKSDGFNLRYRGRATN